MSMFLGPIHFVMFNKIKIAAGRASAVIAAFEEKFPAETGETVKAALPDGPVDFGDRDLEDILGGNPIHQFLQSLIDKVETTEAALVTALLYRFPEEGKAILEEAFRGHGAATAKTLQGESAAQAGDLGSIENLLAQHYLEGLPCDPGGSYQANGDGSMDVAHSDCLHIPKWESAGAPVEVMCELMDAWVEGFAAAVVPGVKMERTEAIVKGASSCRCRFTTAG